MILVEINKLNNKAQTPSRANLSDAGYDLYSSESGSIPPNSRSIVKTGISIAIPPGYYGRVAPRSGLAVKFGIDVLAGVIDSGYRGEVGVVLQNLSNDSFNFKEGERIAQLILEQCNSVEWIELDELKDSQRSDGGFGSTGN